MVVFAFAFKDLAKQDINIIYIHHCGQLLIWDIQTQAFVAAVW